MAEAQTVIEALSDEEKAVAISDLFERIQKLAKAASAAADNVSRVGQESADLADADGLKGYIARRIKNNELKAAQAQSAASVGDLNAARLRMVNLTGSRVVNFRRGKDEDARTAFTRLAGLRNEYMAALNEANAAGALNGGDYIGENAVRGTVRQFRMNPGAERFQEQEPDKASETIRQFFGGKWKKFSESGARYFSMANPMMTKAKAFFTGGRFTPMLGLKALGPVGWGLTAGIGAGVGLFKFLNNIRGDIQNRENEALLSGLDKSTLSSFGIGLSAFGGNRHEVAKFSGGIASSLGGLKYGALDGRMMKVAQLYGVNFMGKNGQMLATTEEYMAALADVFKDQRQLTREDLAYAAQVTGVGASMIRMMEGGAEKFLERIHDLDYLTKPGNNPEIQKNVEETELAKSRAEEAWSQSKRRFAPNLKSDYQIIEGFGNIGNASEGSLSKIAAGTILQIGSFFASAVSGSMSWLLSEFGDFGDAQTVMEQAKIARKDAAMSGDYTISSLYGHLEDFASFFTPEGPVTHYLKRKQEDAPRPLTKFDAASEPLILPSTIPVSATANSSGSGAGSGDVHVDTVVVNNPQNLRDLTDQVRAKADRVKEQRQKTLDDEDSMQTE